MTLPLDGLRILSLEQFGAGPYGTSHLADLGAEVIKIEDSSVGGDIARHVPPYLDGEDCLYFEAFNRNKRSIVLDVANPAGRGIFEKLVQRSDAVFSNLRGDIPAKLGITYDQLKSVNPRIVCCSLTGFGLTGPRRDEPGYDYILQALCGWMDMTGEPDGPPTKSGLSLVDYATGMAAAMALLAGVRAAERTGLGMDCDVSLFDTAVSLLTYPGVWHLNAGYEPGRIARSAHPSLVPFQAFEAADGWIVVACAKEKFWARMAKVLGRPDLASDPRFATFSDRHANYRELMDIIEPILKARGRADWTRELRAESVPAGEVNSVAEALRDPQIAAREMVITTSHESYGEIHTLRSPVRVGEPRAANRRAPRLGEDTADVLKAVLGLSDTEVSSVEAAGAFGTG